MTKRFIDYWDKLTSEQKQLAAEVVTHALGKPVSVPELVFCDVPEDKFASVGCMCDFCTPLKAIADALEVNWTSDLGDNPENKAG